MEVAGQPEEVLDQWTSLGFPQSEAFVVQSCTGVVGHGNLGSGEPKVGFAFPVSC